jgi:replicative DNA helicase
MSQDPPNDTAMERIVLGAMMTSPEAVDEVARVITAETFYLAQHADVFRAIVAAQEAGDPTEPTAIADRLTKSGDLARLGGAPFLVELLQAVPTAANAGWYAGRLADLHVARGLDELAVKTRQLARGLALDEPATAVAQIQDRLDALMVRPDSDDPVPWEALGVPGFDAIDEASHRGDGPTGVPTGLADLDRLLNGLNTGLIIVAGRTSMGKSTAARGFLMSAAFRHKLPSVLFTLEMTRQEVFQEVLSAGCRIPNHVIKAGQMSDAEWTRAARFVADTQDVPFYIDDTPAISLAEIRAKARRLHKRHPLGLVVVDYIQLLQTNEGRGETRERAVAGIARGLKILSHELDCPVVAVSQLNRGPEQRQNKHPQMSDMRESGSIENDANVIILVHREDYYDKESPRAGEADFIVAKHRGGPTDTCTVAAQLHLSRFVDMAMPS